MALLKWGYDDEEKKDESFDQPAIKSVQSVQSGWQPAGQRKLGDNTQGQAGGIFDAPAATPNDNNYLMSDQKAQIDEDKRQRDAAEEAARQQAAAEAAEAQRRAAAAQQIQGAPEQPQVAAPKYIPANVKKDEGFGGFLKGIGAGIQQGIGALGDIAIQGGAVIGSIGKNDQELVRHMQEAERTRAWLHGQKDITGRNFVGTTDVDQQAANIAAGRGTLQDYVGVAGKGLQAGIDATMFMNPARLAATAMPRVASTASLASRVVSNPAVKFAARDAAFYGGLQGAATGASTYGQTGDLGEALKNGAQDAVIGGVLQGGLDLGAHAAGEGVRKLTGRLNQPEPFTIGDEVVDLAGEADNSLVRREQQQETQDGNVSFEQPGTLQADGTRRIDLNDVMPIADSYTPAQQAPQFTPVADGVPFTPVTRNAPLFQDALTPAMQPAPSTVDQVNLTPVAQAPTPSVAPVATPELPQVRSEEVRQLQASRAGTDQAEEAAINQQLQQLNGAVPSIRAYHGSTNNDLTELRPGAELGLNERRNLIYLAEDADTAANYAKTRGTDGNGLGELQDSPTGRVYDVDVDGEVLGAYDMDARQKLINSPEFEQLSGKTRNALTNDTGLSADILENNAELRQFLSSKGVTAVRAHLVNGGGNELIVVDPNRIGLAGQAATQGRVTPVTNNAPEVATQNLPDNMDADLTAPQPMTRQQVAERLMPKLADNSDVKQNIANAVDMGKDVESPVRDILSQANVNPAQAERVAGLYDQLERQLQAYNAPQELNRKAYAEGGTDALDPEISRTRSRAARDMGDTTRQLVAEIDRLEGGRDFKVGLVNSLSSLIGTRNANILTSAGLLERNIAQELTANAKLAIKNPIKMAKSTFTNGNIAGDTAKSELSHWKDAPRNPIEAIKYLVGNTYRTAMIPTTALANTRRGMYRDELTKWAYETLEGRNISSAEAHKLAGAAGNELEALVNTFIGVDNGMTNRGQAMAALKSWKDYIRTGDDAAKAEFLKRIETHSSLADQMIAGLSKDDATKARGLKALGQLIFPFVRTATNLMKTTVRQDLNPAAKSLVDEIRSDLRSTPENAALILKSKLVDYGVMTGAAALAGAGVLAYNDGDEVNKPRGWSFKVGDDQFVPIRATAMELPIALAGAAQQITEDIASGHTRDASYYAGMVTNSLPYIDTFNQTTGAVDSLMSGEDGGYAAQSYGVNMAKSFIPGSNNGVQPYVAGKEGESMNAKTVYASKEVPDGEGGTKKVADLPVWFGQAVRSAYDPEFRAGLKDSRDAAGRVRTVDNQGVVTNKHINDQDTATYNDTIDELVTYGRQNGLGKATADMFNSYDTGKNNNFKSIQDAITFLDVVEGADGKKTPQAEKKLEQNGKLADLSRQIRDGFYGDTGMELLTLDGQELKSDASVPNKAGSKNSRLPMSMQSIKNAVAQTDLEPAQQDALYQISQQNNALWDSFKNQKAITYEQYKAAKDELSQQEVGILSGSKNYQKLVGLMNELDGKGFFLPGGLGATKSGQTYLWNSLNTLLGSKGATPAANYPDSSTSKGFTPWGRRGGTGRSSTSGGKGEGTDGVKWTPVKERRMATVQSGKYTPVNIKVKLGNEVKKNRAQNYSDRSF